MKDSHEPLSKEEVKDLWDDLNTEVRFNHIHSFSIEQSDAHKAALTWFKESLEKEKGTD
tara:strand:+ start:643 stop:819 length:177 start_codon:yes stop_codon:yes gene_type:complete